MCVCAHGERGELGSRGGWGQFNRQHNGGPSKRQSNDGKKTEGTTAGRRKEGRGFCLSCFVLRAPPSQKPTLFGRRLLVVICGGRGGGPASPAPPAFFLCGLEWKGARALIDIIITSTHLGVSLELRSLRVVAEHRPQPRPVPLPFTTTAAAPLPPVRLRVAPCRRAGACQGRVQGIAQGRGRWGWRLPEGARGRVCVCMCVLINGKGCTHLHFSKVGVDRSINPTMASS